MPGAECPVEEMIPCLLPGPYRDDYDIRDGFMIKESDLIHHHANKDV